MKFCLVAAFPESAAGLFNNCVLSWIMSLNKLKSGRPSEQSTTLKENTASRIERPSTLNCPDAVNQSGPPKSFIPTFRSLSQPPSVSMMNDSTRVISSDSPLTSSDKAPENIKNSLLDNEMFNDLTMMTDEFKDCLESVKLDLDTPSTTDFDALHLGSETAEEILKNLKTPDEVETPPITERPKTRDTSPKYEKRVPIAKSSAPIKCLSRKNSNSGIPVSVSMSGKATKPAPKPQRRLGTSPVPSASPTPPIANLTKRILPTTSLHDKTPSTAIMVKRNLEMFQAKKKRFENMRKDIYAKTRPLADLYNSLVQLKNNLFESGQIVSLDPMPVFDFDGTKPKTSTVEIEVNMTTFINAGLLDEVKKSVEGMRVNSVELCRSLIDKRCALLNTFENVAKLGGNSHMLLHEVELHKNENTALAEYLSRSVEEQEEKLRGLVSLITSLKETASTPVVTEASVTQLTPPALLVPVAPTEDYAKELQESISALKERETKIKHLEKQLVHVQGELKAVQAANAAGQESGDALRNENDKLKHKITSLEKLIDSEKRKAAHEIDRMKSSEMGSKVLKGKIKELETSKQQQDSKISQLSNDLRSAQNKLKLNEKNFEKELAELNKSRNLDKAVIERLNRDKSTFEARLEEVQQQAEHLAQQLVEKETTLRQEVMFARQDCDIQANTAVQLRIECEKLKAELNTIHLHSQQSSEILRRKDDDKFPVTERECELQIEVVAQRAAIKALQEKVESNAMEKLRFIETIENMHGSNNEMRDDIVKTLVQKEEEITQLHQLLKKRDDDLSNRRIEVQNLKAKVENLQEHIQLMKSQENDADLKHMIKEGRNKLEDALIKSLENERKLIQYEHEMAQKIQTVASLENTLKLRDGLIAVLKSKKEELVMENKSLNKYSEQIRSFVLESKEELKEKTEIISQLQVTLNEKMREIHKLEKRLHQMEDQLALTNEKRYQLQDAIGLMQRELHMVKSNADAEGETRYDDQAAAGQEITFTNIKDDGPVKIKITVS